jgi:hypothetical protein
LGAGGEYRQDAADFAAGGFCVRRAAAAADEGCDPEQALYQAPEGDAPPPFWIARCWC